MSNDDENYVLKFFELLNKNENLNEINTIFKQVLMVFLEEDKKISIDLARFLPSSFINKFFIGQFSLFLKYLVFADLEDQKILEKVFKKFKMIDIRNKDNYIEILKEVMSHYKKHKLNNTLISHKWQLSVIDKESDKPLNENKFDKFEIDFKFNINNHNASTEDKLLKLNYYEFSEIYENLKKVESQLKTFK